MIIYVLICPVKPTLLLNMLLFYIQKFWPILKEMFCVYLQGRLLEQDTSKGIIMSTQSLVLQHVEVEDVGDYTCRAVNSEGSGESNSVPLKIMCKYFF